jgi:hypothetical protein
MIVFNKYFVIILGGLFMLITNKCQSQCSYESWNSSKPVGDYEIGDIVSYNGADYVMLTNTTWANVAPAVNGPSWSELNSSCIPSGPPIFEDNTFTATAVWARTAFGNANVIASGGYPITARGLVYSTTPTPTISDNLILDDYVTIGSYSDMLETILPSTKYYMRGYATNSQGTGYSNEVSFTTITDLDAKNCNLACDDDASLLDPFPWPTIITPNDTLCVTQNVVVSTTIEVQGTIKMCNNALVLLSGNIIMRGKSPTALDNIGQVIYEGCNEKFQGTGSYKGYLPFGLGIVGDEAQMVSYCGSCDVNNQSQFLLLSGAIDLWNAGCRPNSSVLPVELSSFDAEIENNGALLTWTTASELNNDYFEVQTSVDGATWATITIVQGAGNSSDENTYRYFDEAVNNSIQYYRLKQVDYDGTNTISNIKILKFEKGMLFNPIIAFTNSNHEIEVQLGLNGAGTVYVVDSRGRIVGEKSFISVNKHGATLKFDYRNLPRGIYFVSLVHNNQRFSQKVSVIK